MTLRTPTHRRRLDAAPLLVSGAVLLMVGNIAHPIDADPTPLSRLELATGSGWILIHGVLALGFLVLTAGVVAVGRQLARERRATPAHFATTAAIVGGSLLVAVFGALDGYAISELARSEATAETIHAAAVAEEAIDSGLAAVGTLAFFGLAVGALGVAIVRDGNQRRWVGWSAVVIGAAGTLAGATLLAQGPTTFTINVMLRPVAVAGTVWFIALGFALRGRSETGARQGRALPAP